MEWSRRLLQSAFMMWLQKQFTSWRMGNGFVMAEAPAGAEGHLLEERADILRTNWNWQDGESLSGSTHNTVWQITAEQNTELHKKTILHELLQLKLSPHTTFRIFFPHHRVLIPWRPHVVSLLCWKCVARSFLACCRCIACPECLSLLVTWPRFW